jgi:RNA-directed DNA polymerase
VDNIINSAPGIPIGNYLSQYFGNVYLNVFDHYIKENKKIKYYYRYVDDIVILHNSKEHLHELLKDIDNFLSENLDLIVKKNHQVFPVESRGIDFVGYKFYHTHVLLRKEIKKSFARAVKKNNPQSLASYYGWAVHCNSNNLLKKLFLQNESNSKPISTANS